MGNIVIKNGFILTMDNKRATIPNGVVEIRDDKISHGGTDPSWTLSDTSAITVDASRKVVMPGLIDGPTHLCMTFAGTICFDLNTSGEALAVLL